YRSSSCVKRIQRWNGLSAFLGGQSSVGLLYSCQLVLRNCICQVCHQHRFGRMYGSSSFDGLNSALYLINGKFLHIERHTLMKMDDAKIISERKRMSKKIDSTR